MTAVPIKIISGGQTGADRGALDAAIALDIPHGGWCPKGRRAEDGRIPTKYNLKEFTSSKYLPRTIRNIYDADATLVFTFGGVAGGTQRTIEIAQRAKNKDCHVCNLKSASSAEAVKNISTWLISQIEQHKESIQPSPFKLNVAGPRASKQPSIQTAVTQIFTQVLSQSLGIEPTQRRRPVPATRRSLNPAPGAKDAKVLQR